MDEREALAERFEAQRALLRAVAHRMLGSLDEAEDAVQETWLRLCRVDSGGLDNLTGWLRTVVTRICLDMLRTRKSRRRTWPSRRFSTGSPGPPKAVRRRTRRCWPTR